MSGCGGRVLPILAVSVLQRGELVLPQHLVHNKRPGGNAPGAEGERGGQARVCFILNL